MGWRTEKAMKMRPYIEKAAKSLPDEEAQEVPEIFEPWDADKIYSVGDRVEDFGMLYKRIQPQTAPEIYPPHEVPALWVRVWVEEWPEWEQPTGAHDAYAFGAKVSHNGHHWISDIQANTYEPGVYGWHIADS